MSAIRILGKKQSGHCGYCNSNNFKTIGVVCEEMKPSDYEEMMLLGWRRCGDYYYKPDIQNSCCKLNTIRCDAVNFQMHKKQRKVMNKFNNYLQGTKPPKQNKRQQRTAKKHMIQIPSEFKNLVVKNVTETMLNYNLEYQENCAQVTMNSPKKAVQYGNYTLNSPLVISSAAKKKGLQVNLEELSQHLASLLEKDFQNTIWSVISTQKGFINIKEEGKVNEEVKPDLSMKESGEPHTYSWKIVQDDFSEESYQLYKKYQIAIHKDPPSKLSESQYTNFLCQSSLVREQPSESNKLGLGSFHILHYIDSKLFAVGVLDILPSGISSVYFFYDPEYSFLSPGVWGAVQEIMLVSSNSYKYYYMGYFIETCQKMRYKAEYLPSELLCPQKCIWVPVQDCLKDKSHGFLSLHQTNQETSQQSKNPSMDTSNIDIESFIYSNAKILIQNTVVPLNVINERGQAILKDILTDLLEALGKSLFQKLIFAV